METVAFFLLLPVAAWSGWVLGRKSVTKPLAPKFFSRLDFAISKQPDPAIEALLQMPLVDGDAIDTHLTLGNVFRKRGEIERAIRLHQGLLERPTLSGEYKSLAQLELARDYLAAGVLDRAEALFLELIAQRTQTAASLRHLLELYQQGKEWLSAINVAKQLQDVTREDLRGQIAHFYCELAEQALKIHYSQQARTYIRQALRVKRKCPRALILRANLEQMLGNYERAIKLYKYIAGRDIDHFSLIIEDLVKCYQLSNVQANSLDFTAKNFTASKYQCAKCGFTTRKLEWHCPSCKRWDAIKLVTVS